jgi:hypothetical protein
MVFNIEEGGIQDKEEGIMEEKCSTFKIWVQRFKEEEKETVRFWYFFLINKFSLPFFFIRCKNDSTFHKFQIK